MNVDKYVATANLFLKEVATELGAPEDIDRAGRVLRVVLHTLRDRLAPQESLDLMAQLPILIKGLYVDGWRLRDTPDKTIKTLEDFAEEMAVRAQRTADFDFPDPQSALDVARAVFRVLKRHVTPGLVRDVESELPRRLKTLWAAA